MIDEKKYTEHDLKLVGKLGEIMGVVKGLDEKFTRYSSLHDKEHITVWRRMDEIKVETNENTKMIYKGMGISVFIGAVIGSVLHWLKVRFLG